MGPKDALEWYRALEQVLGVSGLIAIGFGWAAFWAWRTHSMAKVHDRENAALLKILEIYAQRFNSSAKPNSSASGVSTGRSIERLTVPTSQEPSDSAE